jgi:hypothetical protein
MIVLSKVSLNSITDLFLILLENSIYHVKESLHIRQYWLKTNKALQIFLRIKEWIANNLQEKQTEKARPLRHLPLCL